MSDSQEKLPEWMLKLENKRKKQHRLAHEIGAGAPCFVCGDNCPGLDLHFWRKLCRNCKCKKEDHDVKDDEGYEQFEILLGSGSRKNKKGGVLKIKVPEDAKSPVVSQDNSSKGISFDWLPPNVSEEVAAEYMQQLPAAKLPISGSDGALYRRQQLTKQVPLHDLDARHCHNLTPEEIEQFMKYLENLKSNVVGQGCVGKVPNVHSGSITAVPGTEHFYSVDQMTGRALITSQSADPIRPLPPMPPAYNSMPRPFHASASSSSAYGSGEDEDLPPPLPTSLPPRTDLKTPSEFMPDWRLPDDHVFGKVTEGMQNIHLNQTEIPPSFIKDTSVQGSAVSSEYGRQQPQFSSDLSQSQLPASSSFHNEQTPSQIAFSQARGKEGLSQGLGLGKEGLPNSFNQQSASSDAQLDLPVSGKQTAAQYAQGMLDPKREALSGARIPTGVAMNVADINSEDTTTSLPADSTQVSSLFPRGVVNSSAVDQYRLPMASEPLTGGKNGDSNVNSGNPVSGNKIGVFPVHESLLSQLPPNAVAQSETLRAIRGQAEPLKGRKGANISAIGSGNQGLFTEETVGHVNSQADDHGNLSLPQSTHLNYGVPELNQQTLPPSLPIDGVKTSMIFAPTVIQSISVGTDALPKSAEVLQQQHSASLDPASITAFPGSTAPLPAETPGSSVPHLDCRECELKLLAGDVAVFAERAGNAAWHPSCFVCSTCKELLVDLMYFYHKNNVYCGRHFAELLGIPRCFACDELIFVKEYTVAEGKVFHVKHFCCYECDDPLGGKQYIPVDDQPVCLECYERKYGKKCHTCKSKIAAGEQRVGWKHLNWHVQGNCFRCFECAKSLLGGRFVVKEDQPFCSKECVQTGLQKMAGAA